jgi:hypothetical protein
MLHAVTDMPPVVVADLFGLNPRTTTRWAQLANASWNDYLAAEAELQPATLGSSLPGRDGRRRGR